MSKVTFETLQVRINAIAQSERITKAELSAVSREALLLLVESEDIRPINAVLGVTTDGKSVLSPANKRVANRFFKAFVAFSIDGDVDTQLQFTKKKPKQWEKSVDQIMGFLADESNDIWSWQRENLQMEPKPVNYAKRLTDTTKKALESGEIQAVEILQAVMDGGISTDVLLQLIALQQEQAAA